MNRNVSIEEIISNLKQIEITGEEMEYIIECVGMNDQMLRQLIMNNPYTDTTDLLEEKVEIDNNIIDNYKFINYGIKR